MAEQPPEPKLKLPKTFHKCPHCSSTRRFLSEMAKELTLPTAFRQETPVLLSAEFIFPTLIPVKAQALFDVCLDCGALYAIALVRFHAKPPRIIGGGDLRLRHN